MVKGPVAWHCKEIKTIRNCIGHGRRIYTDEEANVVTLHIWGTEFIQFLAPLATYIAPGRFEE